MNRYIAVRECGIDMKSTAGINYIFVAKIKYHQIAIYGAAAL